MLFQINKYLHGFIFFFIFFEHKKIIMKQIVTFYINLYCTGGSLNLN